MRKSSSTSLMSLKPAAVDLLASGKAMANAGELLIDLTSKLDIYGGGLSAVGAYIRNSGDCVAQSAASCRFKTGSEIVSDELREGGTCFLTSADKCKEAIEQANAKENAQFAKILEEMLPHLVTCGASLEAAGARVMQRFPVSDVGEKIHECGVSLELVAAAIQRLGPDETDAIKSSQRLTFAAERMREAGNLLKGTVQAKTQKGKGWIKG